MTAIILGVILLAGVLVGLYALIAPRKPSETPTLLDRMHEPEPLPPTTDWTHEAGEEFAGLSEAARCDLVFAVAALDEARAHRLLEHALGDPAEAVSLAAAHVLASRGRTEVVASYFAAHPGSRADRIAETLALLGRTADNQ